ncbi:MAG: hypothetical protein JWR88_577 [Pseudonocardia sp.]|nr:hypothetical protein [Pseudonocardia sp.]
MTVGPEPGRAGLLRPFLAYTLARLALLAVIAGLLVLAKVPPIVAILVAIVVALPLSLVAFRGLRTKLEAAVAEVAVRRSAQRAALRSQLRGSDPADSEEPERRELAEAEPDRREGGPAEQQDAGLTQDADQPPAGDPGQHPTNR